MILFVTGISIPLRIVYGDPLTQPPEENIYSTIEENLKGLESYVNDTHARRIVQLSNQLRDHNLIFSAKCLTELNDLKDVLAQTEDKQQNTFSRLATEYFTNHISPKSKLENKDILLFAEMRVCDYIKALKKLEIPNQGTTGSDPSISRNKNAEVSLLIISIHVN